MRQLVLQQLLLHINVCCMVEDYYFTILINCAVIVFIQAVQHLIPFKVKKVQYLFEYLLLMAIQV